MKFKHILAGAAVFVAFNMALSSQPCFGKAEDSPKVIQAANQVLSNPSAKNVEHYISTMKKRVTAHGIAKDYEAQADDCRSLLYFLRRNKNGSEYNKYYKKLSEANGHLGFSNSKEDRFEIAKTLFLEKKYFASAYEFLELVNEDYCKDVCYEYLGDISNIFKNPNAATVYYKRALEIEPANYCVAYKLGKTYKDSKDEDNAKEYFETAINLTEDKEVLNDIISIYEKDLAQNQNDERAYEILGLANQKLKQYKKTYELFKKAIELRPDDIFLQYYLGNLLYDMGEYQNAISVYTKILKDNPYETQIRLARAKCYGKLGRVNQAVKDYQVILAIYPNSKQAQFGLYTLLWGKKSFDDTVKTFYPLNPSFKPDAKFYNNLADIVYQKGMTRDAVAIYKKSIALSPKAEWAYIQLFNIYELEGNKAKAYEIAKSAYQNIPNSKNVKKIYAEANKKTTLEKSATALSYMSNKEYEKAIKMYMQTEPKTAETYESIANCYKAMKKPKEAMEALNEAIKLDPANSDYYYNIALLYLDLNSKKTAETFLQKAIDLDRKNLKARKLLSYLRQQDVNAKLDKAYELYEKKDYKNTLVELDKAESLYPYNPQVYYYKALTYQALKDDKNAYKFFDKTLEFDRSFYTAHFYMAQILERQGKEKNALEEYEKFLGADVKDQKMMKQAQDKVIQLGKKYY